MALRHTIPVEDEGAVNLLGKVLANGLSQKELNSAYDDVCKDYDKVQTLKNKTMLSLSRSYISICDVFKLQLK